MLSYGFLAGIALIFDAVTIIVLAKALGATRGNQKNPKKGPKKPKKGGGNGSGNTIEKRGRPSKKAVENRRKEVERRRRDAATAFGNMGVTVPGASSRVGGGRGRREGADAKDYRRMSDSGTTPSSSSGASVGLQCLDFH